MQEKNRQKRTSVYLVNPPWKNPYDPLLFGVRAGSRWPHYQKIKTPDALPNYIPFPHFLATATAMLEEKGFPVMLLDAVAQNSDADLLLSSMRDFNPALVFMEVSTPSIEYDLDFARRVKSALPDCEIALAGPHEPMYTASFLDKNSEISFVFAGEYEDTLLEFCLALETGTRDFSTIAGLVFRDADGKGRATARRPAIEDLDRLPAYSCRHLPMDVYNDRPCGLPGPSLQMWTSRGCPFGCTFCQWPQIMYANRRFRTISPELVVGRSADIVKEHNLKSVYFDDDTFNVDRGRCLELCRLMKERLPGLPWAIMARVDLMDGELLKIFAESGLFSLKYGIETAVPEIQKSCGKNIDLDHAARMIALTKKLGIRVQLTFTFGFPQDSRESIDRTIDFACAARPDYAQFSILTPFPGTKLYNDLRTRGYIEDTGFAGFNASMSAVSRTDSLSGAELEESLKRAQERFSAQKKPDRQ